MRQCIAFSLFFLLQIQCTILNCIDRLNLHVNTHVHMGICGSRSQGSRASLTMAGVQHANFTADQAKTCKTSGPAPIQQNSFANDLNRSKVLHEGG